MKITKSLCNCIFIQLLSHHYLCIRFSRFSRSAKYTYETATNCANLLRCWKSAYLASRSYIESSGVGSRWEFDRQTLFSEVDHICHISQDIAYIGRVFIQYENLFGHRLKALITDPSIVDDLMKKVYRLLDDMLSSVDYDIFRPGNFENWEHTLATFNHRLASVEADAKAVIERSINTLRSSDMGLELIKTIKEIDTREELAEFISTKHENILRFFQTEINSVEFTYTVNIRRHYLISPRNRLTPTLITQKLL